MITQNVLNLIEEAEFSTVQRIFRYGPVRTLVLALYRALNYEVFNYFSPFLKKLDDTFIFFTTTPYDASRYINAVDIGELFNKTYNETDDSIQFITSYFYGINIFLTGLFKSYIDALYNNEIPLNNITSIQSLINKKITLEDDNIINMQELLQSLIFDYGKLLSNKPTSAINIISPLKRFYMDSKLISEISNNLDQIVIKYVKEKITMDYTKTNNINLFKQ